MFPALHHATITVMLILQLGRVATIGFERPYVMGNIWLPTYRM